MNRRLFMLIDFDILTYIICFIILGFVLLYLKKQRNKSNMYLFFFSVFSFYIMNVAKYTIFPIEIGTEWVDYLRENRSFSSNINFIPFKEQDLNQTLLNILLSIPFGFGLSYIKKVVNLKTIVLAGLTFSFSIEMTQLIISLLIGYPYRIIDINDIMANALGAVIGYAAFLLFSKLVILMVKKSLPENEKLSPFLLYIYKVSKKDTSQYKAV
ncbi:VanZ family protein [Cytobacillus sp. FSL M8-0252]|uniref:VanZ family protein n=1 Tax=Cytobacillus sp. FSL M8-0252 TaxID=2921621 RepID=UPI0030F8044D